MYCSDCHGSNTANGTSAPSGGENGNAWGPHGSSNNFILKGDWDLNTGAGNQSDLCFRCHNYSLYSTEAGGRSGFATPDIPNLHSEHAKRISAPLRCSWCHVAVPHGWKNKAFLVNLNDVGPEAGLPAGTQVRNGTTAGYNNGPYYVNAKLKVLSFANSGNWDETDCGSAGPPGNGKFGTDWMRDRGDNDEENCENPP